MRKTIITMLATTAIAFSAISPVQAQTVDTDTDASVSSELSSGTSSGSSEDSEDSDLSNRDIIVGVAAIAAVGGLIAGGVHWAVQQRMIPNPLPGIIPNPPAVAPQVVEPAPQAVAPAPQAVAPQAVAPAPVQTNLTYKNCTEVWNVLGRPIRQSDPGYGTHFDRDRDGIGCESRPR
ncbi:excalibur calcium-binding domain-containing protein [Corynebacterium deserti]|nr:excalibur calcium-binding domain-containing protein [Corynebacterium deserti]